MRIDSQNKKKIRKNNEDFKEEKSPQIAVTTARTTFFIFCMRNGYSF